MIVIRIVSWITAGLWIVIGSVLWITSLKKRYRSLRNDAVDFLGPGIAIAGVWIAAEIVRMFCPIRVLV